MLRRRERGCLTMMKGSLYITFDVEFTKVTFEDSEKEGKNNTKINDGLFGDWLT